MLEYKSQALLSLQAKEVLYPIDMTFKDRLREARTKHDRKITQAAVAEALGVTPQAVSGWERGEAMPEPDKLNDLSDLLGVELTWLLGKKSTGIPSNADSPRPDPVDFDQLARRQPLKVPPWEVMGQHDLPVFSIANGGEGSLILSNEPFTRIARPHNLVGIKESYGVLVIGQSMAREFNEGDIAYINPHLHPRKGDACVFQGRSKDGAVKAIIKYLERSPDASETLYYVSQSNPPEKFTIKKADWQLCHVAVGKTSAR